MWSSRARRYPRSYHSNNGHRARYARGSVSTDTQPKAVAGALRRRGSQEYRGVVAVGGCGGPAGVLGTIRRRRQRSRVPLQYEARCGEIGGNAAIDRWLAPYVPLLFCTFTHEEESLSKEGRGLEQDDYMSQSFDEMADGNLLYQINPVLFLEGVFPSLGRNCRSKQTSRLFR